MQHLGPGDSVDIVSADLAAGDRTGAARMLRVLRLDGPVIEQSASWGGGALTGGLGASFISGKPVAAEILRRLPVNLQLAGMAMAFAIVVGIPIGTLSAVKRDGWTDA